MQWLIAVPAIGAATAVLVLPGLLLAWALRLRGFALVALAPVLSVALVAVAAVGAAVLALPWGLLPVLALTLLAAVAAAAVAWQSRVRWRPRRGMDSRAAFAGLGTLLAALLIGSRLIYVFGSPENISQTFDNIFHLNAVKYILDSGQASSLTVGSMTGIPFYPAGWHAVVSLTAQLAGAEIPVAVNAVNLVIGALVWPLACILLCQQVLGQGRMAALLAGVFSAAFGAFPLMMVDFGVLYPNLLSVSLLPALLALGLQALRLSVVPDLPRPTLYLAAAVALAGVGLAHPSTVMASLAFLSPAVLFAFARGWRQWRRRWPASRTVAWTWTAALVAGTAVVIAAWRAIRPEAEAAFWPPIQSPLGALWELASNSEMDRPPAIAVSVFIAVGLVVLLRRRGLWWLLGMYGVAGFLFLVVSSFRPGRLRDFITAIWYNDSFRLAALIPTAGVVIATIGAVWVLDRARRQLALRPGIRRGGKPAGSSSLEKPRAIGLGALAIAVTALLTQVGGVQYAADKAHENYELRADSELITSDEMAVLRDMGDLVPPDAVVAANAWNGSALAYALADRRTIQLHVLTSNLTAEDRLILDSLREARTDPAVCPAVRKLNVSYALDFGAQEVNLGSHPAPGLENLEDSGVATLLSRHGDAKLFEIHGCR